MRKFKVIPIAVVFWFILLSTIFNINTIITEKTSISVIPEYTPIFLDKYLKIMIGTWTWNYLLSKPSVGLDYISYRILLWIFGISMNMSLSEVLSIGRILFQVLAFIGSFLLLKDYLIRFSNNKIKIIPITLASFIGSLFYGLNPSFMIGDSFWMGIQFSFVQLPWIIWCFNKVILDKNWKYVIICALLIAVSIDERFLWVGFPIILCLYSGFVFLIKILKEKKIDIYILLSPFLVTLIVILLKMPRLIMRNIIFSSYSYALTKLGLDVCWSQATIINMLRAMSHMWIPKLYITKSSVFDILNSLMPITLIIPVIGFLSLLYYKRNWIVLFYSILLILFILPFFVGSPFKWIHYWIFFNLPVGPAFRSWRISDAYIALSLSVLIAFSLYHIIEKLKLYKKRKYLVYIVISTILFVFCIYSWPLLTGNVNGLMSPVKVPNEYFKTYDYLSNQPGYFKVIYSPEYIYSYGQKTNLKPFWSPKLGMIIEFPTYSSPKPTFKPNLHWSQYYKFTLSPFYQSLLATEDTNTLSHFLAWVNIKYVVIHDDIPTIKNRITKGIQSLNNSMNFKLTFHNNFIYVFENKLTKGEIYAPSQSILVDGGYRAVKNFYNSINDSNTYGFIIVDQGISPKLINNIKIILTDKPESQLIKDLMFNVIFEQYPKFIIYPYKYVVDFDPKNKWSRASLLDAENQAWHPFVNWKNYAWDFDYMKGVVFTINSKDKFTIPIKIEKENSYVLLIRCLVSEKGGSFKVEVNGRQFKIDTFGNYNGFLWKVIKLGTLHKGEYRLTVQNVNRFNAINLFVLIPENEYYKTKKDIEKLLQNKTIIYIFEGEYDLYRDNAKIKKLPNASNGQVIKFIKDGKAWQNIEIVKNGTYRLALKGKGNFRINISKYSFEIKSDNNSKFVYTPEFYLPKGIYNLTISAKKNSYLDVIWLYSTKNNESIEQLFQVKEKPAEIISYKKINPTLWKVQVNATKPFMLSFTESYDPLWEARVYKDGKLVDKVSPIPLYGVINGFYINETGNLKIIIRYKPQDWFDIGLVISGITFICCILYLIYDWRREKGDRWAINLNKKLNNLLSKIKIIK